MPIFATGLPLASTTTPRIDCPRDTSQRSPVALLSTILIRS
ncbi:hypothetical protein [Nannocystis pusilla]